jgi:hypothetical protein
MRSFQPISATLSSDTTPATKGDTSVTVQPRLVPPAGEGLYRQEPGPSLRGVVTELGFRRGQGIDAATAGVGLTPVCEEWVIVALGADTCRALVARELPGPTERDSERRFEFLITSDRAWLRERRAACSLASPDSAAKRPLRTGQTESVTISSSRSSVVNWYG